MIRRPATTLFLCLAVCALFVWLLSSIPALAQMGVPSGTYTFGGDSDGGTAGKGSVVTITFTPASGSVVVKAVRPGETFTDRGQYRVAGRLITLTLPQLEVSVSSQPFTLTGTTLVLPFKVFSEGEGASTWTAVGAGGGNGAAGLGSSGGGSGASGAGSGSAGSGAGSGSGSGSGSGRGGSGSGSSGSGGGSSGGSSGSSGGSSGGHSSSGGSSGSHGGSSSGGSSGGSGSGGSGAGSGNVTPNPEASPYVGDWAGIGWGWEVRFKSNLKDPQSKRQAMTLTVRHLARFDFTVDKAGNIAGDGEITYDLDPNLCGVARLTEQVNESVNMMAQIPSFMEAGSTIVKQASEIFSAQSLSEESELANYLSKWTKFQRAESNKTMNYSPYLSSKVAPSYSVTSLAQTVWEDRCLTGAPAVFVGGLTCGDLREGPFGGTFSNLAGTQIHPEDFWDKAADWLYEQAKDKLKDKVKDKLKDKTKDYLKQFGIAEEQQKSACEGSPTLKAGTSVNASGKDVAKSAASMGQAAAGMAASASLGPGAMAGAMLSVPGVTQVNYEYKGLANGPESRRFKLRGNISGGKMNLKMDGDVYDGDKDLVVEYMVNWKRERKKFPTWSPFIQDGSGDVQGKGSMRVLERQVTNGTCADVNKQRQKLGAPPDKNCKDSSAPHEVTVAHDISMNSPFATFHKTGEHRNNVKVWHEYEYFWYAHQITRPESKVVKR